MNLHLFQQLSIHESSFLYNLFKKPPLDVFIAITVFNITNAEAFLNGSATQLHVTEIGPFVYQYVNQSACRLVPQGTVPPFSRLH